MVCANLPYNITTPVITAFLEAGCFSAITVMIQREVARRICAAPGSSDYGAFSVFCQYYAETELLFDVPPECFLPAPKVTSAVVRLAPRKAPPQTLVDDKTFFRVVKAAFAQRRKTLLNSLSSGGGSLRISYTLSWQNAGWTGPSEASNSELMPSQNWLFVCKAILKMINRILNAYFFLLMRFIRLFLPSLVQ